MQGSSTLDLLAHYPNWGWYLLWISGASLLVTGLLYAAAYRLNLLPGIRSRDVHTSRKPRVGGVAMWLTGFSVLLLFATTTNLVSFGIVTYAGLDRVVWGILLGMLILLVFGLWDDLGGLPPSLQLLGQFLAALAIIWGGVQVEYIRLPVEGMLRLDSLTTTLPAWLGGGIVWPWSALFTVVWVLVIINVINLFDGLDGLAGSVSVTAGGILFLLCLRLGFTGPATLALITTGLALGFLPWNWHPARIFMGTVGSQLLGFLLAVTAIVSGAKVATAVLVLGMPVLDAVVVIGRRLLAGTNPFTADQRHLHHRLLKIGLPVPLVVVTINAVAVIFGLLAIRTQDATGKGLLTLLLLFCMLAFIIATYLLERRVARGVQSEKRKNT